MTRSPFTLTALKYTRLALVLPRFFGSRMDSQVVEKRAAARRAVDDFVQVCNSYYHYSLVCMVQLNDLQLRSCV